MLRLLLQLAITPLQLIYLIQILLALLLIPFLFRFYILDLQLLEIHLRLPILILILLNFLDFLLDVHRLVGVEDAGHS